MEMTFGDGDQHLSIHDLPFQVCNGIIFASQVISPKWEIPLLLSSGSIRNHSSALIKVKEHLICNDCR
jgi:hypothetical protein